MVLEQGLQITFLLCLEGNMLLHFPGVCFALSFLAFTGHLTYCRRSLMGLMDYFASRVLTISHFFATTLNSYEHRRLPFSLWLPPAYASVRLFC